MSDFKIGEPTKIPSFPPGRYYSKWTPLLERVHALNSGSAIPLEFFDLKAATAFANGKNSTFRRRGVCVQRRGMTIYLSKAEQP